MSLACKGHSRTAGAYAKLRVVAPSSDTRIQVACHQTQFHHPACRRVANQEQLPGFHEDGEHSERAFEAWLRDAAILPPAQPAAPGSPGCGAAAGAGEGAAAEGDPATAAPVRTTALFLGGNVRFPGIQQ